jgi:hypothetical protein
MKKTVITLCFLTIAVLMPPFAAFAEMTPEEIISRSWELYRQAKDEKESVKVAINYQDGRKEEKELVRWTKFDPSREDRITIKFTAPPLDRGLGLLTLRHSEADDEQWLKLPSFKKVRKVAAGEQEKYFAGTDFTNEDIRQLIGERTKDFNYELASREGTVWKIKASPKPGIDTGYGHRLLTIDDKFVMTGIDYYGKSGDLIKSQTSRKIVILPGGMWRVDDMKMKNVLLKRTTSISVASRDLDLDLSQRLFSKEFLESEGLQ